MKIEKCITPYTIHANRNSLLLEPDMKRILKKENDERKEKVRRIKGTARDIVRGRPLLRTINRLLTSNVCRSGEWHGPVTDHFDGRRFFNFYPDEREQAPTREITKWWFTRRQERIPVIRQNIDTPDLAPTIRPGEWECTVINHATHLIRFEGINILTDPVWSDRPSPFQFVGPKRRRPAALAIHDLPDIDVVVISHDHYDHLDLYTLAILYERFKPIFIVPLGNKVLLESEGIDNIIELDWWEHATVNNTEFHLTPARHYSARYRDADAKNKTLWGGYFMKHSSGVGFYFCGDTAWTKHFADIRERLGQPDVSLLSTGAYKPRRLMRYVHMSPSDAVKAHQTLGTGKTIAFHYGTWRLTDENQATMRKDIAKSLERRNVPEQDFIIPNNGMTIRGVLAGASAPQTPRP